MPPTILSLLSAQALADNYARCLWRDETHYQIAAAHVVRRPAGFAVQDRFRRLTWRALIDAADLLAGDLARRGLRPNQRVALWMPDRIESIIVMLASSRLGLVCCPSPHRNHTAADVTAIIDRLGAAVLIHQSGFGADAGDTDAVERLYRAPTLRHVYRLPALSADDAGRPPFAGLLTEQAAESALPPPVADANRVSYIAFTSGSTGPPKGVMHSDNTQLVSARAICRDWGINHKDVVCSMSPLSHNLGVGALLTALVAGAEFVVHDAPRGSSVLDRLVETQTTYLVGVPTHALDIMAELRVRKLDRLGAVRAFRVSGAASPPHIMDELMSFGVAPQSGYGMTENNSHQYTRPGDNPTLVAHSCGRACEGYEIAIFDPDDPNHMLPIGQQGLVAGRGACLMLGYFDDQLATERAFNVDGWFLTGDLGTLDANGYLRLNGRRKDVIIRGGHNIDPARIENAAEAFPGLAYATALSLPDERLGERICMAYMTRAGAVVAERQLMVHLSRSGLSRYELPEFLLALEDMPLMANGKIDKSAILASIIAGTLKPRPAPSASARA